MFLFLFYLLCPEAILAETLPTCENGKSDALLCVFSGNPLHIYVRYMYIGEPQNILRDHTREWYSDVLHIT